MDDIEAIKRLKARYCRLMDTKDWEAYRQCFTNDVTMDTTDSGGNVITGADEFLTFLVGAIGGVVHRPPMPYPRDRRHLLDGGIGIWAMEDMLRFPDGSELHGYGHYHERYQKIGHDWLIKASTLTRLRLDFSSATAS